MIVKENLNDMEYEELRSLLIQELGTIKEPDTGENLVQWICRREELYSGEYITKYPDIVFDLRDGYGAGWALQDSIISPCHTHNIQPGSHKIYSPVFLMSDSGGKKPARENISMMDIGPTVLELLGIEDDFGFDGKSMFAE